MVDQPPIPRLLLYLFGDAAEAARSGAAPRLLRWCRAFDDWLEERRRSAPGGACCLSRASCPGN
jgi:hypothetical protein